MNESQRSGGIGCLGVLAIVFIVLKLTHLIGWSWWWVLAPLWIGPVLFGIGIATVGVIVGCLYLLKGPSG